MIFLDTPNSRQDIATRDNINFMQEFVKSTNLRIKNLAGIFLNDVCNINQDNKPVKRVMQETIVKNPKIQRIDQATSSRVNKSMYNQPGTSRS